MPRPPVAVVLLACAILVLGLAACGDDDDDGGGEVSAVEAVDSNCSDVEYQGEGDPSGSRETPLNALRR